MWDLGSSTRNGTPCIGSRVLTTRLPEHFEHSTVRLWNILKTQFCGPLR